MKILFVIAALLGLSGCSTLKSIEQSPIAARIVTSQLTMRYIESADDKAARAVKVATFADEARTWLDFENVTVPVLKSRLLVKLGAADLSPADRDLANDFSAYLTSGLESKLGAGPLDDTGKATVNTLLDWVISATQAYR